MGTLLDMKTRIADELSRSDLTSQIAKSITTAIAHHERKPFWFNDGLDTFSTVASQEYYGASDLAAIATLVKIRSLRLTVNGSRYPIQQRPFEYIDQISVMPTVTGWPNQYAYWNKQIRVYPIPQGVYTFTLAYIKRLAALADGDTNAWTDDAEVLIRTRAKLDLMVNVMREPNMQDEIAVLLAQENAELMVLRGETGSRGATGYVQPMAF
jgi:hypothetical protein